MVDKNSSTPVDGEVDFANHPPPMSVLPQAVNKVPEGPEYDPVIPEENEPVDPLIPESMEEPYLPQKIVSERAYKYHVALADKSPGVDKLVGDMLLGGITADGNYREELAANRALEDKAMRAGIVGEMVNLPEFGNQQDNDELLASLAMSPPVDRRDVLEDTYSREVTNKVLSRWNDAPGIQEKARKDPDTFLNEADVFQGMVTKREFFVKGAEDESNKFLGSGVVNVVGNVALTALPFWSWYQTQNAIGTQPVDTPLLPGGNIETQVRALWAMPFAQAKDVYQRTIEDIRSRSPADAVRFATAVAAFSSSERLVEDVFGILDLSTVPGVVKAIGKSIWGLAKVKPPVAPTGIAGSLARAQEREGRIVREPRGMTPEDISELRNNIKSLTGPINVAETAKYMSREDIRAARLGLENWGNLQSSKTVKSPFYLGPAAIDRMKKNLDALESAATVTEPRLMNIDELNDLKRDPIFGEFNGTTGLVDVDGARLSMTGRVLTPDEIADLRSGWKDVYKSIAANARGLKVEDIVSASGDIPTAARVRVGRRVEERVASSPPDAPTPPKPLPPKSVPPDVVANDLPDMFRFDRFFTHPGNLSREMATRLNQELNASVNDVWLALRNGLRVPRGSTEFYDEVLKDAERRAAARFDHETISIMDVRMTRPDADPLTNTGTATVVLGKKGATPFDSEGSARWYALNRAKLKVGSYEIKPVAGGKYVIETDTALIETAAGPRAALIATAETRAPESMWGVWLGKIVGSKNVTSEFSNSARNLATHIPNRVHGMMEELSKNLQKLSRAERNELNDVFKANRDYDDPSMGTQGQFYDTAHDFETAFGSRFNKTPSEAQTKAYFSYVMLDTMEWALHSLGLYRDMSRQGVRNMRVTFKTPNAKQNQRTQHFYGREAGALPEWNKDFGLMFFDGNSGTAKYFRSTDISPEARKSIDNALKGGEGMKTHRVIQTFNPNEKPLGDLTSQPVNFIVAHDFKEDPLDWQAMIPFRPGGHREYATQFFVKQPHAETLGGRLRYFGDRTLFGVETKAEADRIVAALEHGRKLMKANDMAALAKHLDETLPPELGLKGFLERFKQKIWDENEPFLPVSAGRSTLDDHKHLKKNYVDEFHSPYNLASNTDRRYLSSRDPSLWGLKEVGTEAKPGFELTTARMLDPLPTLQRSLTTSVNNYIIGDYRHHAMESWVAQFWDTMAIPRDRLDNNPLYYLNNPVWDNNFPDAKHLAAAKASRQAIRSFLGMDTPDVAALKWFQLKTLDAVYASMGQEKATYVAAHMFPTVRDPVQFARTVAFDLHMGFFNPIQLFNQMQSMVHSFALSPRHAPAGVAGATWARAALRTQDRKVWDHYDAMMSKTGIFKRGQFNEAMEGLEKSGWWKVQGETSVRDDISPPALVTGKFGQAVDGMRFFFREGERMPRLTGWFTAYREWKTANPNAAFDAKAIQHVLNRADDMNVNMTRSSQAAWQSSALSIPTQFWSYQIRMMEQVWGGRLSRMEKMRLFATYGALYGVPVTTGMSVGMWPMYDMMRTAFLEQGIDVDSMPQRAVMDGLLSAMVTLATGKDTNFSPRLGPQGLSAIRDLLYGDKTWFETIVGASGGAAADIMKTVAPALGHVAEFLQGKGGAANLLMQDAINVSRNITTLNNGFKAIYAINYGKYLSKNDAYVADVDIMDTTLMTVFGLTRQDIADAYLKLDSARATLEAQRAIEPEIVTYLRRGFVAMGQGDLEGGAAFHRQAKIMLEMGGFRPDQIQAILKKATENRDLLQKADEQFYLKGPLYDKDTGTTYSDRFKGLLRKND